MTHRNVSLAAAAMLFLLASGVTAVPAPVIGCRFIPDGGCFDPRWSARPPRPASAGLAWLLGWPARRQHGAFLGDAPPARVLRPPRLRGGEGAV